jgi:hypothetical protein
VPVSSFPFPHNTGTRRLLAVYRTLPAAKLNGFNVKPYSFLRRVVTPVPAFLSGTAPSKRMGLAKLDIDPVADSGLPRLFFSFSRECLFRQRLLRSPVNGRCAQLCRGLALGNDLVVYQDLYP